jgi:NAD(P)H-hydrate repair Nnr-like enzyme with NAD(P)H-hydrate epimerase domain
MCAKRYKVVLPSSSQRIRKAKKTLREMSKLDRIDLMVKAGSMTQQQAEKAKKKLGEIQG